MAVAVITGGSRGLGRALARGLASRGWSLVIDGRDEARLAATAGELRAAHDVTVVAIPGDVTDPAHRDALVRAALLRGARNLEMPAAAAAVTARDPDIETAAPLTDQGGRLVACDHAHAVSVARTRKVSWLWPVPSRVPV